MWNWTLDLQEVFQVHSFALFAQVVSWHKSRLPIFFHHPPAIFSSHQHLDHFSPPDTQLVWGLDTHKKVRLELKHLRYDCGQMWNQCDDDVRSPVRCTHKELCTGLHQAEVWPAVTGTSEVHILHLKSQLEFEWEAHNRLKFLNELNNIDDELQKIIIHV